ncbi:MAG: Rrf2 family transcriptional regulator [Ignavibacteriae bacterium]|nr:Rrf2 family transcriptional regulator [Ignavibacteriota bacterium]MCB0723606.1 Rrf2 family transcriptional regulator [Ignavibacteriota bacterium]MCB9244349.1 Rrf2 family transcriptional regulator [Ignavibacteriales bacterium]
MLRLSKKVEYALMALRYIVTSKDDIVTAKEISTKFSIPHELLAKILQKLKKERILESIKGVNGGYRLEKSPEKIKLTDLIKTLDGDFSITECIHGQSEDDCNMFKDCTIKTPVNKIQKELESFFETKTISDFV